MSDEQQHQWAVYAPNGDVLTTLEKASEGSYWLYKQKLEGTVGPYPDRDRPMLEHKDTCPDCEGRGFGDWAVHAMPMDDDGNPIVGEGGYELDPTRDHEGPTTCGHCAGRGKVGRTGSFRSDTAMKGAITKGTAKECTGCNGRGEWIFMPIKRDCSTCGGHGKLLRWDPTRPVLPPNVSDCDSAPESFMADYLNTITISVVRSQRELTWGESWLGLVGLGTCTDYGRRWEENDDDALIFDVVEDLLHSRTQFTKMIDRVSRTFGPALIINVTRQGYTTLIADTGVYRGLGGLPPTYFPAVFKPMSTALNDPDAY